MRPDQGQSYEALEWERILRAHEPAVRAISDYLMMHEVMPAEEILARIGSDR
jgi:hypothetical protein